MGLNWNERRNTTASVPIWGHRLSVRGCILSDFMALIQPVLLADESEKNSPTWPRAGGQPLGNPCHPPRRIRRQRAIRPDRAGRGEVTGAASLFRTSAG